MLNTITQVAFWTALANLVVLFGVVNQLFQDKLADKVRAKLKSKFFFRK